MRIPGIFFPALIPYDWPPHLSQPKKDSRQVDVAQYAKAWLEKKYPNRTENPLLNPNICQQMIKDLHTELGVHWSYGGYLEDRGELWKGSYITERDTPLHLGIDVNVSAGTAIATDFPLRCLQVDNDHPEPHGWGGRIVVRAHGRDEVFIISHVEQIRATPGTIIQAGEIFANVGASDSNGGWYPHVHIQLVNELEDDVLLSSLSDIDGYGAKAQLANLVKKFPDPTPYLVR